MRFRTAMCAVALLVLAAAPTWAQSGVVVNPKTVQFPPSADHDRLGLDGTPMVTRYELRMYLATDTATVISATDLGKPTPTAGTISVTNPLWFSALTPNTKYIARVAAIGPTGEGVSDASGPFGMQGPPGKAGTPVLVK
jgi:hypothetical protein